MHVFKINCSKEGSGKAFACKEPLSEKHNKMKKIMLIASLVYASLTSCNNAALDGDPSTDTTNTTGNVPTSAAPYGDTAKDVNNDGTQSGMNTRTDVDSASNSNRPGDSTGGINSGIRERTPASEGQH